VTDLKPTRIEERLQFASDCRDGPGTDVEVLDDKLNVVKNKPFVCATWATRMKPEAKALLRCKTGSGTSRPA
jgi:hypothetical protein